MKLTIEIELDKLVMTDGVNSLGKQVASVLRDKILDRLEDKRGSLLDWDAEIVGKWEVTA